MSNFCKRCIHNGVCNKKKEFKHIIKELQKITDGEIYKSSCDGTMAYEGPLCEVTIKCNRYIDEYNAIESSATDESDCCGNIYTV